jgi:hypothetical protein
MHEGLALKDEVAPQHENGSVSPAPSPCQLETKVTKLLENVKWKGNHWERGNKQIKRNRRSQDFVRVISHMKISQ